MLVKLLDAYIKNLSFAALLVSAGLLILVSNRDAFEVDSKPREIQDPAGPAYETWQWKYMSDYAEYARLELLHLVRFLRVAATTMLITSALLFAIGGLVGVLGWLGYKGLVGWWETNSYVDLVYSHSLGILFLIIGPIMIYRLARVASNIVRARNVPGENKPGDWTPY